MKAKKICFDKPNLAPKEAAAYLNISIVTGRPNRQQIINLLKGRAKIVGGKIVSLL